MQLDIEMDLKSTATNKKRWNESEQGYQWERAEGILQPERERERVPTPSESGEVSKIRSEAVGRTREGMFVTVVIVVGADDNHTHLNLPAIDQGRCHWE